MMRLFTRGVALVFCALQLSAALTEDEWLQKLPELIEEWDRVHAGANITAIVDLSTDDFILLPAHQPAIVGKEAFRESESRRSGNTNVYVVVSFNQLIWAESDSALAEITFTKGNRQTGQEGHGKGLRLYRRENGVVKLALSVYNLDS